VGAGDPPGEYPGGVTPAVVRGACAEGCPSRVWLRFDAGRGCACAGQPSAGHRMRSPARTRDPQGPRCAAHGVKPGSVGRMANRRSAARPTAPGDAAAPLQDPRPGPNTSHARRRSASNAPAAALHSAPITQARCRPVNRGGDRNGQRRCRAPAPPVLKSGRVPGPPRRPTWFGAARPAARPWPTPMPSEQREPSCPIFW